MPTYAAAEREIRALVERRVAAIRAKDVDGVVSGLDPDVVIFDVLPPLQRTGAAESRTKTEEWLGSYDGPVGYEVRDLAVTAGEEVAFARYLYRVAGTLLGGAEVDMWVRMTVCLERVAGRWTISHEHTSVPFDAESGKASLHLVP